MLSGPDEGSASPKADIQTRIFPLVESGYSCALLPARGVDSDWAMRTHSEQNRFTLAYLEPLKR
jgi:hypothetical protein